MGADDPMHMESLYELTDTIPEGKQNIQYDMREH
jgi:hypothetical protein